MNIAKIKGACHWDVVLALVSAIAVSRFRANIYDDGDVIKVMTVRLRASKDYCGNHPHACERPGGPPHKKGFYLEGADWVEFNDMLNTVLDNLKVEANVSSSAVILRKGGMRRTEYGGDGQVWRKDEDAVYSDFRGLVAPPSDFPKGTPGRYEAINYTCVG